jgi:protein-tyrosine phosphatase
MQIENTNPGAKYLRPLTSDVTITREPNGSLQLNRTVAAQDVTVFVGTNPERIDRRRPVVQANPAEKIALEGLSSDQRHYFSVQFRGGIRNKQSQIVAERFLPLEGAVNVRDLGGYKTITDKSVRWGRLFRANALGKLTESDVRYLSNITKECLVCDFRGVQESAALPDVLPIGWKRENLPLEPGSASSLSKSGGLGEGYIRMIEEQGKPVFVPFLRRVAQARGKPMLYHCTAGKDRTGIASVLLLSILEVPEETILADYALTNAIVPELMKQVLANPAALPKGLDLDKLRPMMVADPAWIEGMLAHIKNKYGSVGEYLAQMGLESGAMQQIRRNYLQ